MDSEVIISNSTSTDIDNELGFCVNIDKSPDKTITTTTGFVKEPLDDVSKVLKDIWIKHLNKLIIGNLNINVIAGKFEQLKSIVQGQIAIQVITETKLHPTYPESQFLIDGFLKPYRFDRNKNGGGVLIYIREDIPSKKLFRHELPDDIEGIFVEINFRKTKWLLLGTYHPPRQSDE